MLLHSLLQHLVRQKPNRIRKRLQAKILLAEKDSFSILYFCICRMGLRMHMCDVLKMHGNNERTHIVYTPPPPPYVLELSSEDET